MEETDSLHANPRKIKLHSPKYHRSCTDFLTHTEVNCNPTAHLSQQHMTPKPHPKKPGILTQALHLASHCPAPKLYWSTICPGYQRISFLLAGQDPLSPVLCRGSQSELHCLLSSPPRCCCKSKERLSYLPQCCLLDCQQRQRDWWKML